MSAMESMFWTTLAWLSGPAILVAGFAITALIFCFWVDTSNKE